MSRTGPKTTPIHDSNIGPKSTPTNHGTCQRERQRAAFATRKDTSASKKKLPDKAAGRIIECSNDIFEKFHEGEN